jgi:hypothetical protein
MVLSTMGPMVKGSSSPLLNPYKNMLVLADRLFLAALETLIVVVYMWATRVIKGY